MKEREEGMKKGGEERNEWDIKVGEGRSEGGRREGTEGRREVGEEGSF